MSNRKKLRLTMPCGFAAKNGAQLTFTEVKSRPGDAISVDRLSEDQKRNLTIDCWNHGFWDDIFIGGRRLTKSEAIHAVKNFKVSGELGYELVQITMTGYAHIYKSFLPHDEEKWPLAKLIGKPELKESVIPQKVTPFRINNDLSITVYIYKLDINHKATYVCDISAKSRTVIAIPNFAGQSWIAYSSKDPTSSILGFYKAYRRPRIRKRTVTTWDIASFPKDRFVPSAWNCRAQSWNLRITNNLKTYVCIWQVIANGSLKFLSTLPPCNFNDVGPCYIGTSLVAIQGDTVISKFFADSTGCTTWSLDIDTPPGGEEIYATGDNNYIFYQVHIPQDDTVALAPKTFSKKITISSEVAYLYASLFDSYDTYFAAPDVVVTINSQDAASTAVTYYNSNTNTNSLYIQMTTGQSLQKLCIKDPPAGVWTIKIQAMTNTPMCFQFQTVPTKDPYGTMKATLSLSSMLGSNWEDIAYAGFANVANTQKFIVEEDIEAIRVPTDLIHTVVEVGEALLVTNVDHVIGDVQNYQAVAEKAINTVRNAAVPTPSDLHNILLVDADGDDDATKFIFKQRLRYLYQYVIPGVFRKNYSKLIGKNEAIRENFQSKLKDSNLKLVSVAGHGNKNCVYGYIPDDVSPIPILSTSDVTKELAKGKIFHFLACNTASNLGPTLEAHEATVFIGYKELFKFSFGFPLIVKPDCIIDRELTKGRTVNQAVENAKAEYKRLMNNKKYGPTKGGLLEHNCNALVVIGDGKAKLLQDNNQVKRQKSTSLDEKQKSTSQDELANY